MLWFSRVHGFGVLASCVRGHRFHTSSKTRTEDSSGRSALAAPRRCIKKASVQGCGFEESRVEDLGIGTPASARPWGDSSLRSRKNGAGLKPGIWILQTYGGFAARGARLRARASVEAKMHRLRARLEEKRNQIPSEDAWV